MLLVVFLDYNSPMDSLIANIAAERCNIEVEIANIEMEIAALYVTLAELSDSLLRLNKAEAELRGQSFTEFKLSKPVSAKSEASVENNLTIKQMALKVLADYPDGLTALQILSKINSRFEKNFIRTSLSPQLSRLNQTGDVHKRGKRWLLGPSPLSALRHGGKPM